MAELDDLRRQVDKKIKDAFSLPPHLMRPDPRLADYSLVRAAQAYERAFAVALLTLLSRQFNTQQGETSHVAV